MLSGLFTRDQPFFRTPKRAQVHAFLQALADCREEILMMLALWLCAWGVYMEVGTVMSDLGVWVAVLLIQSIPYFAALLLSLVSAFPGLPASIIGSAEDMDELAHVVLGNEHNS